MENLSDYKPTTKNDQGGDVKNNHDTLEGSIDPYGLLDDKKEPYCSDCRSLEKELDVIRKESLGFEYEIEKLKEELKTAIIMMSIALNKDVGPEGFYDNELKMSIWLGKMDKKNEQ